MTTKQVDFADLWKGAGRSIIGGQIFVYSCSAQLISFEIDYFYSLRRRVYEYLPPPPPPPPINIDLPAPYPLEDVHGFFLFFRRYF